MREGLIQLYLDWVNNYLTRAKMAEHYDLDIDDLNAMIEMGLKYHEENIERLK